MLFTSYHYYFFCVLLFLSSLHCKSQPVMKAGTIQYQITKTNTKKTENNLLTIYFKPGLVNTLEEDNKLSFLNRNIIKFDLDSLYAITYDQEDGSIYVVEEILSSAVKLKNATAYEVKIFNEKRNILGYSCQKFIIQPQDTSIIGALFITGWASTQIETPFKPVLNISSLFPGLPLEMTIEHNGITSNKVRETYKVIEIQSIYPDSAFVIPQEGMHGLDKSEMAFPLVISGDWFFKENDQELEWTVLKERSTGATITLEKGEVMEENDALVKSITNSLISKSGLFKIPVPAYEKTTFLKQPALKSQFCVPDKLLCICLLQFIHGGDLYTITIKAPESTFEENLASAMSVLTTLNLSK